MKKVLGVLYAGLCAGLLMSGSAQAQLDLNVGGVRINTAGGVNIDAMGTQVNTGKGGVVTSGVRVSEGKVWIDGQQIPAGQRDYVSPKTGKHYRIHRSKGGNVSVEEV